MPIKSSIHVNAVDIPDAWFQCISNVLDHGFRYVIEQGSFVGQTRLEFDWITVRIQFSYAEPYDLMLPKIPEQLNIPNPVESGYVEQYLPYLMSANKKQGEDYTYGERLCEFADGKLKWSDDDQINHFINLLKKTPNTNQAILQVAQPSDCLLDDPPCLRHIDMRIRSEIIETGVIEQGQREYLERKRLVFYPYFRSWDLWSGFPANLAAIAVLQKYMADEIGVDVGPIIASSKGLHIYGYVEDLAKIRANKRG